MQLDIKTNDKLDQLRAILNTHIIGNSFQIDLSLTSLIAGGHILIQGNPGTGKTSFAKLLSDMIRCNYKRIQFTPDLLPADILGFSMFNQKNQDFEFIEGPVFTNILLADEINRTTPRIQSALLEAMNEKQVTIDGKTRQLSDLFFVIATQNHFHTTGTYPLPESQLDRFLISFEMNLANAETNAEILRLHLSQENTPEAVISEADVLSWQESCRNMTVSDTLVDYLGRLGEACNNDKSFRTSISSRALLALMRASQAWAFLNEQTAVYPEDVKLLMPFVFAHRLQLKAGNKNFTVHDRLDEILKQTEI
ncbi:MAG: AAA family ATPase [Lentisphaeria bacterium]|nr:AAA family ATPase [Lentisphaeria bacterium]NQZ68533.1 AAA family ATPase [Lentisphaeria bacterium]